MRKTCFYLIVTLCILVMPIAASAEKSVSGTITMQVDLSNHQKGEVAQLWMPYPLSDRDQLIDHISVTGDYAESAVYSDQKYSTPILYARWKKDAQSRRLTLSFHVIRKKVTRRNFPDQEGAWNRTDFALYLAPTSLGPIDGPVKTLADKITRGRTTVLAKAKAIYDWTCENMFRDPKTKGCGKGDVCLLLNRPGGKCTDIHSVFVALCRAAGIPAREIFGIRLGKKPGQDISTWQHCWAEFYLPGYDWVPVDPADVRKKMLKEHLRLSDEKTRAYRDYFWGGWDAYRVKLAVGRDIQLNPPQKGGPINTFGYPFAQIGDKTLDHLNPKTFSYRFTFH